MERIHNMNEIGIIGAGAWGTALAAVAARTEARVTLWAREEEVVQTINDKAENSLFLPNISLPRNIYATSDLQEIAGSNLIVIVIPSQHVRSIAEQLQSLSLNSAIPLVIASKGIENESNKLMSEVIGEILPGHPISIISGPTFAAEVAKNEPSAISLSCKDSAIGNQLVTSLSNDHFKLFYNNDIVGAQIGGSVKNILAIGCGIATGLGKGDNVNATLMTLGLAEMGRFSVAKGGDKATNMELCCVGDLVLTCSSMQSRNMSLGYQLGRGSSLSEILSQRKTVAEGVATSKSVHHLSKELSVEMPICNQIYRILHHGEPAASLLDAILAL